jgi:hypothetical protein
MALAKARGLMVISLESTKQHGPDRPKIPNVCAEMEIGHLTFHGGCPEFRGTSVAAGDHQAAFTVSS